jgi:uncharacterized protein (DUF4415 family)
MTIVRHKRKPLTPEQSARLKRVANLPDEKIDFSDIPDNDDGYEVTLRERGKYYRPLKQQVTLRLDADTLDWFKRQTPKGYQTNINRVLSEYVGKHHKKTG